MLGFGENDRKARVNILHAKFRLKFMSIIWPGRSLGFVGLSAVGDDPGLGARLAAAVLLPPHVVDNVLLRRLQCEMREKIAIKI